MKMWRFLVCLLVLFTGPVLHAEQTPDPSAILEQARLAQTNQSAKVTGRLRTDGADTKTYPFNLDIEPGKVTFDFTAQKLVIQLTLGEEGAKLDAGAPGALKRLEGAALHGTILDTDVTYQDLSLQFLYWPEMKYEKEEVINTRKTWKILLRAPIKSSLYAAVFAWVDQESGALMQLEGYNWEGKHVKRFKVISGQKIADRWMLKQMRVEVFNPGTRKVLSRTYIEIDGD